MEPDLEALIPLLRSASSATSRAVGQEIIRLRTLIEVSGFDMAMVRARRTVELLLRSAIDSLGQEPGTRGLDQVMTDLSRANALPPIVERHCRVVRDFGNLAAHSTAAGTATDALMGTLTATEVRLCLTSLAVIVAWYCEAVIPRLAARPSFRILRAAEIGLEQLTEAAAIDVHVYPPEFRGKPDVLLGWHRHNSDLFTMAADVGTGRVVGWSGV